jgi:hypothetical protein
MIKEFNIGTGILISIFDGLFAGGISGCLGEIIKNIFVVVLLGIVFGVVMLMLDFKYSYDEI